MPPRVRWPAQDIVRSAVMAPQDFAHGMGEKSDGQRDGRELYLLCYKLFSTFNLQCKNTEADKDS